MGTDYAALIPDPKVTVKGLNCPTTILVDLDGSTLTVQNVALAQTGQAVTPSLQVQVGDSTSTFTLMVISSVASAPRMSTAPRTSIQIGPANLYNNHNLRHIMYVACTGDNCEQQRTESVITNLPVY